jgi:NADH-quinone oxidoreductase subunit M
VLLASVALPLTIGFPGEILMLQAIYVYQPGLILLAGSGIVLGAVYMLYAYRKLMLGPVAGFSDKMAPLTTNDKLFFMFLSFLIIAGGLFPQFILDVCRHDILELVQTITLTTEAIP